MSNIESIYDSNFCILTQDQFANDFPDAEVPDDISESARILVFHTDDDGLIAGIWGSGNDFATFTAELAKYAAGVADPGTVQERVGTNHVELAER